LATRDEPPYHESKPCALSAEAMEGISFRLLGIKAQVRIATFGPLDCQKPSCLRPEAVGEDYAALCREKLAAGAAGLQSG